MLQSILDYIHRNRASLIIFITISLMDGKSAVFVRTREL